MKTVKKMTTAIMLCMLLAGCGTSPEAVPQAQNQPADTSNEAAQLLSAAEVTGSVTALNADGFVISPDQEADGGQSAVQAAPGHEGDAPQQTVRYQQDCVFQLATIDAASGAVTLTEVAATDMKKNMAVAIYGKTQADGTVLADKVIITRFEGATGVGGA